MAKNLLDLANSLEDYARKLPEANSKRAIACAMVLLDSLVWRTPVDTSTALSNWQVSLNAPVLTFINAYVPGYLGYTQAPSARAAIEYGTSIMKNKKPGESIFITNNTPYIIDLEHGKSKQAPTGMVQVSLLAARKAIPDLKVE